LYSKGHYVESNPVDDMKKLIGNYADLSPEHVSRDDIKKMLTMLIQKHLFEKECYLGEFIEHMDPMGFQRQSMNIRYDFLEFFIRACCGVLRFITCIEESPTGERVDLLHLGEADPKVLPLKKYLPDS